MPPLPPKSSKSSPRGAVIEPEENYNQWDLGIPRRPVLQGYRQRIDRKPSTTEHEAPMNPQQLRAVEKRKVELDRDQERHVQVKAQWTAGLITDFERSRRSISERRAAWVPPLEGHPASESFDLGQRQRRRTSMRSISSATATALPENDDEMRKGGLELGRQVDTRKVPWTALMGVGEKDSDISRRDGRSYSAPGGRDENHAGHVSASRARIPTPSLTSLKEGSEMVGQAGEHLYDRPSDKSPSYPANNDHRSSLLTQSRSATYDNARNLPHLSTRTQSISQEPSHAKDGNDYPSSSGPRCVGPKFFFAGDELLDDQDSIPQKDSSPPWDSAGSERRVFSGNHYKDSRKDGERERQASSVSSSRLFAKYKSTSSATRAGSRDYLRNDSFEDRERLNSDEPDHPPKHARRTSYSKSGRIDSERHRNDIDYSARIEKPNREEQRRERANPVVSGLASHRGSDTQVTFTREWAEHFHSIQREPTHTTIYKRPSLPETCMTPELADSGLEDASTRLRRPTPEKPSIVAKKDRSLSRTTDHERSQCSICELYAARSPPTSGARKPSISPAGSSAVSKHFVHGQQGSPTSVRSVTTASGTQPPEVDSDYELPEFRPRGRPAVRTKGPLASSEKAREKGSGTRHSGGRWYSIFHHHGGDERHASPVPASLRLTPIPSLAPPLTARAQRTVPDFSHPSDSRHHSSSPSPPVTRHIGRQFSVAQDGRSDYHDFIPRHHLSPPHSADSGWKGLTHSSSNNSYQESHEDRKLMRHYSFQSPSDSSRYHTPPSLVPKTRSGGSLQDLDAIDSRERLDHVMKPDVKSDHRSDRARQSSNSRADVSERDSYDDYSASVFNGLPTTTGPQSVPRRVTSPPVGEVSSWKDWVGVPQGRRGHESTFRPLSLHPGAGATLPHSAGRRGDASHLASELTRYHNHPAAYSPCDDNDGLEEEYTKEPGLSGENSAAHGPVKSPFWAVGLWEEDWRQEEIPSQPLTARQRSFDEIEKTKQLEKEEELRTEAEGGGCGTDETEEKERKGQEEETGKREEDSTKRKQAEDTRQGFQDWGSSDCFGHIYYDGLSTIKPISAALLQRAPLPDDSVPHSENIQERLCRLDEMDMSKSRILLLEKIHKEMWAELPTIGKIKWDDLPWPVFVRTTCPEDLMLHRIVSYLLQVSSGMDIKEALLDCNRLQWAQQRLRILLGHWGQPSFQKRVETSENKTMIQGVNVVMNHLKIVLDFVNTHLIDETHTDLTSIISQTFLKHVGENLARILTDTSDNSAYKSLLKLEGESAQKMLNFLQTLLDCSELVSLPRNDILGALLRLSKLSKLYPECLTITDLERDSDVLDSGRFGEIYKGRSRNQAICLKIIKVNRRTEIKHLLKAFLKEALLWGHLSHPNILPFYGIYHLDDTNGRISFVSPWMENGNVTEYLKKHPLANRLLLIWDIILGIQFLHQNQVIHGDLKGLNVLVNRNERGCLADFGLANLVDEGILCWTSIQTTGHQSSGTLRWQAPELIDPPSDEMAKATPASDIYSFACVCYEIYTGHVPFHEISRDITVMRKVVEGSRPPRPADTGLLSDEIWKVIEMCWNQEPQNRPSAESVIEQLLLAGIVDDRPSGDDHLAPSDFRAAGPENLGVVFDPAVDVILSSVLRSTRTNEVEPNVVEL